VVTFTLRTLYPQRKWFPLPYSDEVNLSVSENSLYSRNIKM